MTDTVIMPKELTAENGAKALFMGEFKEVVIMSCEHCDDGRIDHEEICEECGSAGDYSLSVPISWDKIKDIYKLAVKHLAVNPQSEDSKEN